MKLNDLVRICNSPSVIFTIVEECETVKNFTKSTVSFCPASELSKLLKREVESFEPFNGRLTPYIKVCLKKEN